jgi:hypothetical protein
MSRIKLHAAQSEPFRDLFVKKTVSNAVVCASRGFGKSVLAATCAVKAISELLQMPDGTPNRNVALIAPTFSQAVDIYYPLLAYQMGLENAASKCSRANGTFWFGPEVHLRVWSYEASERMRGTGQYFVVADEITSWEGGGTNPQEAMESVVMPCITTRWPDAGRSLTISTPKGHDYFYDMYNFEDLDDDYKAYHYTYRDSPFLSNKQIEKAKLTLDPLKFAREYEASFDDSGNTVFYCFDRKAHVDSSLPDFAPGEVVHACIDFNVGIMACSIFALRGGQMHFISEFQDHPDTESLAKRLQQSYQGHEIIAYPDPSGRARKTSAAVGKTDFSILESHGIKTRARRKHPPIIDSVAAVNRKLKNANGDMDMYIHPRCKNTIRSLERTTWTESNPNIATIDKRGGDEHYSDGVRYATEYLFPVASGDTRIIRDSQILI